MLVISRAVGDKVYLYVPGRKEPVVVTIVDVDRGKVRLGLDADRDILISRSAAAPGAVDATPPMPAREG